MNNLKTYIEKMKGLREAATKGEWHLTIEESYDESIWLDEERTQPLMISDMNFIDASANEWLNILKALEIACDALEKIRISENNLDRLDQVDNKHLQIALKAASHLAEDASKEITKILGGEKPKDEKND